MEIHRFNHSIIAGNLIYTVVLHPFKEYDFGGRLVPKYIRQVFDRSRNFRHAYATQMNGNHLAIVQALDHWPTIGAVGEQGKFVEETENIKVRTKVSYRVTSMGATSELVTGCLPTFF